MNLLTIGSALGVTVLVSQHGWFASVLGVQKGPIEAWVPVIMFAVAVFLDALVMRCVLLPAMLQLLGPTTWRLPRWLDARLPHINSEGSSARALPMSGIRTYVPGDMALMSRDIGLTRFGSG
jgi:uncharacterized membrane protein YdfJ with MMPL/SSD domain